MIDRSTPDWYRDAVIYQTHVKAFFDSNDDGVGDLPGLTAKLDYIQSLGVTAVWLLPFYPSPLRDDGYDIADYRSINAAYGTMRDFRRFVRAAHERGLRVITELVVNHTSDQHPWFQRARAARPGSRWRDYYVWSETDQRYGGTRIIFVDTEKSNWTWDPVAGAFFWHRFYSHQPDLNYGNPRVLEAVLGVMRYWLDMGVDGMRLDAVPYLCEREGTNNENLPETHAIIKQIRAEIDRRYADRLLLAEANQWPEDVQAYFGGGDECHMCFHFPLMPRMYMAIAREDRHPVTDIMRQTPDIPEGCQWAVFLRNHDELTLEMVTDSERDYLWQTFAVDRRMRINLGIRRRLAPLLDNDRRKIELMNSLLLSMPGTPILYYGDEIGMGDNIYLGDRDGVRTPMQWTPDRNGGFSRATPARLYLPAIMDPIYGYEAINVEAQASNPSSLLNWTRRILQVRQQHRTFGRGTLRFLYPGNRKILAYLREHDDEKVLCVANLSRAAQSVELDLAEFKGRTPVDLLGGAPFPPIAEDASYQLTLPAYGFFWLILAEEAALPHWYVASPEPLPELFTLVVRGGWTDLATGRESGRLASEILPSVLPKQRWFAGKDDRIAAVDLTLGGLGEGWDGVGMAMADVRLRAGGPQRYFLPLAVRWGEDLAAAGSPLMPYSLAKVRRASQIGVLYDATADDRFARALVEGLAQGSEAAAPGGRYAFRPTGRFDSEALGPEQAVTRLAGEQSNTSLKIGDVAIVKVLRRVQPGLHPDIEVGRFLTEVARFPNVPPLLGALEHIGEDGERTALAMLHGFVQNQGTAWSDTLAYLGRFLEHHRLAPETEADAVDPAEEHGVSLLQAALLGQRTAEMHRALATPTNEPDFGRQPAGAADARRWGAEVRRLAASARPAVDRLAGRDDAAAAALLDRWPLLDGLAEALAASHLGAKIRVHGDYHLGQVLVAKSDFVIVDFEGEPTRPVEERRARTSPLKDVAGLLRSLDYAAAVAARESLARDGTGAERVPAAMAAWRNLATASFVTGYQRTIAEEGGLVPDDPEGFRSLLRLFLVEKALYEITYEAANRPDWLAVPVAGCLELLGAPEETAHGR